MVCKSHQSRQPCAPALLSLPGRKIRNILGIWAINGRYVRPGWRSRLRSPFGSAQQLLWCICGAAGLWRRPRGFKSGLNLSQKIPNRHTVEGKWMNSSLRNSESFLKCWTAPRTLVILPKSLFYFLIVFLLHSLLTINLKKNSCFYRKIWTFFFVLFLKSLCGQGCLKTRL